MMDQTTRAVSTLQLGSLLASSGSEQRRACQPELLAIGVLTLPIRGSFDRTRGNLSSPTLRNYHRSVHNPQRPVRDGRVCLRYVITAGEFHDAAARDDLVRENRTHGDVLEVPAVPSGALDELMRMRSRTNRSVAPLGAACVLKILSWLQHASTVICPLTPFLAYGDDDTFWALTRVATSLAMLPPLDAHTTPMYLGSMQYHAFWDFQKMIAHGYYCARSSHRTRSHSVGPACALTPRLRSSVDYSSRVLPDGASRILERLPAITRRASRR